MESVMENVTLAREELRICAWVGKKRYEYATKTNRDPGLGSSATLEGAGNHITGAECELSGSIMVNMYWRPSIGQLDQKDVGGLIEVRSTALANGRLIVKPKDDGPFVLVIKEGADRFRWGGWIMASNAKKFPLTTKYGDPAHFVPQEELNNRKSLLLALGRPWE